MRQILLVEDDAWLAELYCDILQKEGKCQVLAARTAVDALETLNSNPNIELIILDMFLPEHNGIEFLHEIASYDDLRTIPIIILSSVYQHDFGMNEERWRHYGVVDYLYKPTAKPQKLITAVKKQLTAKRDI